jgi:hypothetical protein
MPFSLVWDKKAAGTFEELRDKAKASVENRQKSGRTNASKEEGLFKQVKKCINLLQTNPRHPGLQTHEYSASINPYNPKQKVFEAYVQQNTAAAYRVFWCYGPGKEQITILAIIKHPR